MFSDKWMWINIFSVSNNDILVSLSMFHSFFCVAFEFIVGIQLCALTFTYCKSKSVERHQDE